MHLLINRTPGIVFFYDFLTLTCVPHDQSSLLLAAWNLFPVYTHARVHTTECFYAGAHEHAYARANELTHAGKVRNTWNGGF